MAEIRRIAVGAVELAYETLGNPYDPSVLLIMGLGAQLHYWPDDLCRDLIERGLFVIRYDNRDTGESTHLSELEPDASDPPYSLSDLAADAVGLIAALGFESAHLVGISLGGMIAQVAAIEHPEHVRSLVSISSTTGNPAVGAARADAIAALLTPPPSTREGMGDHAVALAAVIGSPGFEIDKLWIRERTMRAFDRGYDLAGVQRQFAAVAAAADRTAPLREVRVPTLVVHGSDDPLVDVSGGRATADAIPDSELLVIKGMGHDLPPGVWTQLADGIARTVRRATPARAD